MNGHEESLFLLCLQHPYMESTSVVPLSKWQQSYVRNEIIPRESTELGFLSSTPPSLPIAPENASACQKIMVPHLRLLATW